MPVLFRHSRPPFVHSKFEFAEVYIIFLTSVEKKNVGTCLNRLNDAVVTIIHNCFCEI